MAEGKPSGIIYIEPNRLLFYSVSINKVLFQDFPPDTVSDLDVINKDKFVQILNFFIQNALQKAIFDLTLVFSAQATFEKALVPTISKDADALFSEFSSLVPFEEVLSRIYKENKSIKAYAINKTLYELLADCFAKSGSTINLVLPVSIIIEKSPELSNNFNLPAVAGKVESLKAYNMLDFTPVFRSQTPKNKEQKSNRRVYILSVVFVILLLIAIVFAYNTFSQSPTKPKNTQPVRTKPSPTIQKENITQTSPTLSPIITQPTASNSSNPNTQP